MTHWKSDAAAFAERLATGALTRRDAIKLLAGAGVAVISMPAIPGRASASSQLEVSTWQDYSAPELFTAFQEKNGAPSFQLFSDNEEALQKIRAGALPSLVQPGSAVLKRFRDAGVLAPIDVSKIANYADIFPSLKTLDGMTDGDQVFAVPAVWGDSSIIYRRDLVPEYANNQTWNILWDAKYSGRLATRNSADSVVVPASLVLGIADPYNMSDADLEKVRAKLVEQRPLLRFYWSNQAELEQALASGEVVAAYGWSSSYATLKKQGVDVGYMTPKEGRLTWLDTTVRVKDGPGTDEEALAYIDAFISAQSGKFLMEKYGYGSPKAKAYEITSPERLTELGIQDPAALLTAGEFYGEFVPELNEKVNAMFEEIKAGL